MKDVNNFQIAITCMKNVSNFQIAKVQRQGVA